MAIEPMDAKVMVDSSTRRIQPDRGEQSARPSPWPLSQWVFPRQSTWTHRMISMVVGPMDIESVSRRTKLRAR